MNKNIFLIGLLLGAVVMFNVERAMLDSDDISIKKKQSSSRYSGRVWRV